MKTKILVVLSLFAILFAFAACSSGADKAAKVKEFAVQACACKDKACGENVLKNFAQFVKENKNASTSSSVRTALQESVKKMTVCLMKQKISPVKVMQALRAAMK